MPGETALDLLWHGGPVMWPLLACSLAAVAITMERFWTVWRYRREARRLRRLGKALAPHEYTALAREESPLADLYGAVLQRDVGGGLERAASRLGRELRRSLWLLGTIGSLAPFIGLLGTVIGIIRAFEDMARTGSGGFAVVAAGISEALVATAAGLLVGVVAILAYNALSVRIATLLAEVREDAEELSEKAQVRQPVAEGATRPEVIPHAV